MAEEKFLVQEDFFSSLDRFIDYPKPRACENALGFG
jgi:hypothetical protein